jgi:hypothetical protein
MREHETNSNDGGKVSSLECPLEKGRSKDIET